MAENKTPTEAKPDGPFARTTPPDPKDETRRLPTEAKVDVCPRCGLGVDDNGDGNCAICYKMSDDEVSWFKERNSSLRPSQPPAEPTDSRLYRTGLEDGWEQARQAAAQRAAEEIADIPFTEAIHVRQRRVTTAILALQFSPPTNEAAHLTRGQIREVNEAVDAAEEKSQLALNVGAAVESSDYEVWRNARDAERQRWLEQGRGAAIAPLLNEVERIVDFSAAETPLRKSLREWLKEKRESASPSAPHGDEDWRVGRKVRMNVYAGDRPVCQCHSEFDASLIVAAVNGVRHASPSATGEPAIVRRLNEENGQFRADCIRLNGELAEARKELDEFIVLARRLGDDRHGWMREFNMYRSAWLREIGGQIKSKTHEIDGFVLMTREIYEKARITDELRNELKESNKLKDAALATHDELRELADQRLTALADLIGASRAHLQSARNAEFLRVVIKKAEVLASAPAKEENENG